MTVARSVNEPRPANLLALFFLFLFLFYFFDYFNNGEKDYIKKKKKKSKKVRHHFVCLFVWVFGGGCVKARRGANV